MQMKNIKVQQVDIKLLKKIFWIFYDFNQIDSKIAPHYITIPLNTSHQKSI